MSPCSSIAASTKLFSHGAIKLQLDVGRDFDGKSDENQSTISCESEFPPKSAGEALLGAFWHRFSFDFSSKSRPKSSCDSSAPCEKKLVEATTREHGDIAFRSVKTSVPAMFAKKQVGGKARNIDRKPHQKHHRTATCAARVDETVSATISAPKSTKNPSEIDQNRQKSV